MWKMILGCVAALAALSTAACGTTRTLDLAKTMPGADVIVTGPGPIVTKTAPGPTTTVTTTVQPPVLTRRIFSGSGQWNSPEFTLACGTPAVEVTYSFSGNSSLGSGDNFIAELESPDGDSRSMVNTIAASGGTATTVYPQHGIQRKQPVLPLRSGDRQLDVQAERDLRVSAAGVASALGSLLWHESEQIHGVSVAIVTETPWISTTRTAPGSPVTTGQRRGPGTVPA